jgi:predicted dehydrogenase
MAGTTAAVLTDVGGAHLDGYFTGLAASEEVAAVVVVDPSGASEAVAKKALSAKLKSFERDHVKALADHQPTFAIVTVEAVQAPPIIQAALEANCHVLAEKPSCVRAADFESLTRLADMKHRNLALAFANRQLGTVQAARKLIRSGQIGQIYGCELHIVADQTRLKNANYHKSWFADRARSGGGHLMWLGIHWIDLIMYLTESKIIETAGFAGLVGGQPLQIEDSAAMALRFDNGSFGTITSGYYLDKGYHSHFKIWGSHGWVQLEPHGGEPLQWYSTKETPPQIQKYAGPANDSSYTPLVKACVRASLNLEPPPVTGADSLLALKTIFACYRAAETGQTQKV